MTNRPSSSSRMTGLCRDLLRSRRGWNACRHPVHEVLHGRRGERRAEVAVAIFVRGALPEVATETRGRRRLLIRALMTERHDRIEPVVERQHRDAKLAGRLIIVFEPGL